LSSCIANYLLTGREAWFRKGYYVRPDSRNFGKEWATSAGRAERIGRQSTLTFAL